MKPKLVMYYCGLILSLAFIGCKKNLERNESPQATLIDKAQLYYSKILRGTTPEVYNPEFKKAPRKDLSKFAVWSKAIVVQFRRKPAVLVPIKYTTASLVHPNFGGQEIYDLNDLSKLLIYWDDLDQVHGEYLTYFPDGEKQNRFTGILVSEDWQSTHSTKYKFEKNGVVRVYTEPIMDTSNTKSDQMQKTPVEKATSNAPIIVCFQTTGYNYSPVTGQTYSWTEYFGCSAYYLEGPENNDYSSGGVWDNSAGGYASYGNASPVDILTTYGPENPVNISQELECFQVKSDASYYVTININQPYPGTRVKLNPFTDRKVGHVFFSFTQLNADNSYINRNVGFYPASIAKVANPIDYPAFGNDSNTPITVALTIEVSASEFQTVKQTFVSSATRMYDLNNYNCVDAVLDALDAINFPLPRTIGTINAPITIPGTPDVLFRGLSPADLGEDIRHLDWLALRAQNGNRFTYIERYGTNEVKRPRVGTCP